MKEEYDFTIEKIQDKKTDFCVYDRKGEHEDKQMQHKKINSEDSDLIFAIIASIIIGACLYYLLPELLGFLMRLSR